MARRHLDGALPCGKPARTAGIRSFGSVETLPPLVAGRSSEQRRALFRYRQPLFFLGDPEMAVTRAADSSRTTHAHPEAVDACRFAACLIIAAHQGRSKDALLAPFFAAAPELWAREPLTPALARVAAGSFLDRRPPDIRGTGYGHCIAGGGVVGVRQQRDV